MISAADKLPAPVLELSGIHKQFPGVKALSDVGLRLYPGEVHTLMGQNGAGKSTLIKVLTGVYAPDSGRIVLDGRRSARRRRWRRKTSASAPCIRK